MWNARASTGLPKTSCRACRRACATGSPAPGRALRPSGALRAGQAWPGACGSWGENLHRLYRGADLFVMPNVPAPEGDMEGFGVVMLEAGLSGLPTVAARLEGIRDVIAEGENGHLVPPRDAEAFAAAVRRYHDGARDPQTAGQRAAVYVERTFGWPAVAGRYVKALAERELPGGAA